MEKQQTYKIDMHQAYGAATDEAVCICWVNIYYISNGKG